MPDPSGAPDPAFDQEGSTELLTAISREMVTAIKTYFGKGPIQAKSYLMDDLLLVVMRGGQTVAEETMVQAGRGDSVRQFRQEFVNVMAERLIGTIEQLTGRRVLTYQSQVLFDPHIVIEVFFFDDRLPPHAVRETILALADPALAEVNGGQVVEAA
jgi:uncharacterized protein YbcI